MPPFKKYNPGCNCCDNVLVWDIGEPRKDGTYNFGHYSILEEIYNDMNVNVDYLVGSNAPSETFYDETPNFDPYDYAVEEGNWTGNIADYRVIFWPNSISDVVLSGTCGPHRSGQDYPWTIHSKWGGVPAWWDEDIVLGKFEGRVVMNAAANAVIEEVDPRVYSELGGYARNVFLNTLSDDTGMTCDDTVGSDVDSKRAIAGSEDLMEGISFLPLYNYGSGGFSFGGNTTKISGGATIMSEYTYYSDNDYGYARIRIDPPWCQSDEGTREDRYAIAQRSRQKFPQQATGAEQKTVDFVILQAPLSMFMLSEYVKFGATEYEGCGGSFQSAWCVMNDAERSSVRRFVRNLYETSIIE